MDNYKGKLTKLGKEQPRTTGHRDIGIYPDGDTEYKSSENSEEKK